MAEQKKYLYGPVPSRRLGRSLGVDIIPFKVCTLDCVYCQLGATTQKTLQRADYVPVEDVLSELKERLGEGLEADYITIGGSGEPTLHAGLGRLVNGIKRLTDIPVTVLTNGTLLYRADVRADCAGADVVLPSLDGCDEETFKKVNRPCEGMTLRQVVDGLCAFRKEFAGPIWLEVFLIEGYNTDNEQIGKFKELIAQIQPDKVHLNTAVRPTAESAVKKPSYERLCSIAEKLGPNCEVIAEFTSSHYAKPGDSRAETVFSMLKRRPCSLEDIHLGLGIDRLEALKIIDHFTHQGLVISEQRDGIVFFKTR